jgi:hypothetical protein
VKAGVSTVAIGEWKETPSQWRLTDSPEGLSLIFAGGRLKMADNSPLVKSEARNAVVIHAAVWHPQTLENPQGRPDCRGTVVLAMTRREDPGREVGVKDFSPLQ